MIVKTDNPFLIEAEHKRVALFGGVYNNYLALEAAIDDAKSRGVDAMYCLGDLGAFGPYPNRVFPLLLDHDVAVVRGNYDDSIGRGLNHCQCGYTDPRDNLFAAQSYAYTFTKTDPKWRPWLCELPEHRRFRLGQQNVLLCHGSPRTMNEFLWESTTSTAFLDRLTRQYQADVICSTHTGIKWERELADDKLFVNVGVLGRPENDGMTNVWYTILDQPAGKRSDTGIAKADRIAVEFVPVQYDYQRLASEMRDEKIAEEFIQTINTGYWTTCLEIMPAKERRRGKH